MTSSSFPKRSLNIYSLLRVVLEHLGRYGLKLKPSRCRLGRQQTKYLDHLVNATGIAPDPDKIKAVQEWPLPQNTMEVRAFLGLVRYYRRYIWNLAKIASSLYQLLCGQPTQKKGTRIRSVVEQWQEEQQLAFKELKDRLMMAPVLAFADFNQAFQLYTDASLKGLGTIFA
ncbi:uncharacterized protein LOC142656612 [Rhinoderma darwinii]|uniref:uncharacterized protein LOC142656612 n=1 Tax=Rhinoderma darwinii TaxID=43563 RepID=UPI003F67A012